MYYENTFEFEIFFLQIALSVDDNSSNAVMPFSRFHYLFPVQTQRNCYLSLAVFPYNCRASLEFYIYRYESVCDRGDELSNRNLDDSVPVPAIKGREPRVNVTPARLISAQCSRLLSSLFSPLVLPLSEWWFDLGSRLIQSDPSNIIPFAGSARSASGSVASAGPHRPTPSSSPPSTPLPSTNLTSLRRSSSPCIRYLTVLARTSFPAPTITRLYRSDPVRTYDRAEPRARRRYARVHQRKL